MTLKPGSASTFLLISANVGSVFENDAISDNWMGQVIQLIERRKPTFLAIHFQEVGGKHFVKSIKTADGFFRTFQKRCELFGYTTGCAYYDNDCEKDIFKFTALGTIFLYHYSICDQIERWNFSKGEFEILDGYTIENDDLEQSQTIQKHRFAQDFFPSKHWGRKGYMRTRWKHKDLVFDLVNVHLFHDESNLVSVETPSFYPEFRRKALLHTMKRLAQGSSFGGLQSATPMFVFGDMNFRLNQSLVIERLAPDTHCCKVELSPPPKKRPTGESALTNCNQPSKYALEYRNNESHCVLRLEKKRFSYENHCDILNNKQLWKELKDCDKELDSLDPGFHEFSASFIPTYPFVEDPSTDSLAYMQNRAPAWCDRILMNDSAWKLVRENPEPAIYEPIGLNTCMGDHKPVYLLFKMN